MIKCRVICFLCIVSTCWVFQVLVSLCICCCSVVVDNLHKRNFFHPQMSGNWESSPRHMVRLDVRSLLQDAAIEEVWRPTYSSSHSIAVMRPKPTCVCVDVCVCVCVCVLSGRDGRLQPWRGAKGGQRRGGGGGRSGKKNIFFYFIATYIDNNNICIDAVVMCHIQCCITAYTCIVAVYCSTICYS